MHGRDVVLSAFPAAALGVVSKQVLFGHRLHLRPLLVQEGGKEVPVEVTIVYKHILLSFHDGDGRSFRIDLAWPINDMMVDKLLNNEQTSKDKRGRSIDHMHPLLLFPNSDFFEIPNHFLALPRGVIFNPH